jgi:signal transduction histidine kinase/ActR/RegA family two-component response regulator
VEVNPAFERQTGLVGAEGRSARELVPDLEQHWFDLYGRVAITGEPDRFESGSEAMGRFFDVYAFRIDEPERRRVALLFNDISERRLAELALERSQAELRDLAATLEQRVRERSEELRVAEEALRQSQKMEAVGQLTGGLAHDFNNLLTGMMGNLELLQTRIARGRLDDVDRFVNAAQGAGRRAASLTQRLLAFSRRQTLDPKPTNVNKLIAGMEELLRRTVGGTTEIEIVGAAGLWTANIDAGQLENALLNLCINARDAMPDGGRITVETANKWLDERTGRERDLPPGQYLSICVTDTGVGMSAETIERAFEPFYTTKPIGQGTGLGLSMIYGFARQSGGQVRIYSELGVGTTVCVYLPRHIGEVDASDVEEAVRDVESAAGQTVLIVEDEATIRHLVDEVLDEAGYTVIGAADGASGIKVLQSGARVELLITDVGLPNGMNGRQVADAARSLRPGLKVLFITGYAENAAVGNGHLEPGMELLTKPFSMEALVAKVGAMLNDATVG